MLERIRKLMRMFETEDRPPPELARAGMDEETYARVRAEVLKAYRDPPRIALIGETGVGKSSTINGLFNAGCEVSDRRACTQVEAELTVRDGTLRVFDMPGLGEDLERDAAHLETYARVLPGCDAVLWILTADVRAIANVQRAIRDLIGAGVLDARRLVVGLNQVDLAQPGPWNRRYNIPNREQEETIRARAEDVREKIGRVAAVPADRVVAYSALKRCRLHDLLEGIEAACDRSRVWVLQSVANCADFEELAEASDE